MMRILLFLAGLMLTRLLAAQTITGFEYWFDQEHNQRVFVAGSGTWNNPSIQDPDLSNGPHEVHMRLKDTYLGQARWSSVVSRHFVNGPDGPYQIMAVRYWSSTDPNPTDMRYKYFSTPVQFLNLTTDLDFCGWNFNNWTIKFQLLDNHGYWSSVVTRSGINSIQANAPNTVSSITASGAYCPGDQVTFTANHTVAPPNGTPTSFTWNVPDGNGWIAQPSTSNTILVTIGSAADTLSVVANNYCGSSAPTSLLIVPVQPAVLTGISGPVVVCEGASAVYTTQLASGTFHWSAPTGWTFNPPNPNGNSVTISPSLNAIAGPMSVYVTNVCGDNSDTVTVQVAMSPLPGPVNPINWPAEACTGIQIALDVTAANDATDYEWTTPWDTDTAASPFLNVLVGMADGTITANATNGCGDGPEVSIPFNALQAPAQPLAFSGCDTICVGAACTFSVQNDPDVDHYLWEYPDAVFGWAWTDDSTNTVTGQPDSGAQPGFITVFAVNECDTSTGPTPIQLTVNDVPSIPGPVNGPTSVCTGAQADFSVTAVPNADYYGWAWPNGWSGTTGDTTATATVGGQAGPVLVSAANICGATYSDTLWVSIDPVAQVPIVVGDLLVCAGEQTELTVQSYDPLITYEWSTGSADSSVVVGAGSYWVLASNGLCPPVDSATVAVVEEIFEITLTNGNTVVDTSSAATYIVVPPPGADHYVWHLPAGWAWAASDTDSSDATAMLIAPSQTGSDSICVTAVSINGCEDDTCWMVLVLGEDELVYLSDPIVYPNPSNGQFTIIGLPAGRHGLMMRDALGRVVYRTTISSQSSVLDLTSLSGGCYELELAILDQRLITKVVIQR